MQTAIPQSQPSCFRCNFFTALWHWSVSHECLFRILWALSERVIILNLVGYFISIWISKIRFHASTEHVCSKGAGWCKIAFGVTSYVTSAKGMKQSPVPRQVLQAFIIVGLGMMMSKSATNKSKTSMQFVAFKCMHCKGEYATQRAYNGHRSHIKSAGTPCQEASSQVSLTYKGRADLSTGILRQHQVSIPGQCLLSIYEWMRIIPLECVWICVNKKDNKIIMSR